MPVAAMQTVPGRNGLRVLHAAPYLWSGAGHAITRLIEWQQQRRYRVRILTSPRSGDLRNWPEYERRLIRMGAGHGRIELFRRDSESFWATVDGMRREIESFRPDVIHTHAGVPTAAAALARTRSSRRNTPLISHFYSWGLGHPAWMDKMDLWAFCQADAVVCSARACRALLRHGGVVARRLTMIPWGVDVNQDSGSVPEWRDSSPVIGTVGRIERRKGQLELVRAFARLRRAWPEAHLEVVGPIAEEGYAAEIRAACRELALADAVHVTGHVENPRAYLARWSAYVSLSADEGQGLAVLEAMAAGVPVIARRVAGIEDYLVDGRTGISISSSAASTVAQHLHRVLGDRALASRVAARAMAMVRRRYGWNRAIERIDAVYGRLLAF